MTRPYREMPEPPRSRLGGHTREWIGVDNTKGVLDRLHRYAEACGPLARISVGPVRMVHISDATLAAEALDDPRANHKGAAYILTRAVLDNVLLLNGAAWEHHRGLYKQALRGVEAIAVAATTTAAFAAGVRPGSLALDQAITELVSDTVARFTIGRGYDRSLEPHRQRVQYELAGIGLDLQCRPWSYLSPARWWKLRESVAVLRRFFRAAVDDRLARPQPEASDILAGFLRLADAGDHPRDAGSLAEGVVNFFFTAHDVLASSTMWCLHLLARHPAEQSRLRAALRAVASTGELTRRELDDCEPLAQIVRESLRLYPGYAMFARTTQADMTIGGYEVPRHTMLVFSPYVTHRLERHHARAHAFEPQRWRDRPTAAIAPSARAQYMPFGTGARGCLASHLAVPIVKTIVATIVREHELSAPAAVAPTISYWGTIYAEHGLPVAVARA